jgi:hypothetical protein
VRRIVIAIAIVIEIVAVESGSSTAKTGKNWTTEMEWNGMNQVGVDSR